MMTKVGSGKYTYELVKNWGKLRAGETFAMVSAVATDSQNKVYVFQRKDPPIVIFDTDGSFLGSWETLISSARMDSKSPMMRFT